MENGCAACHEINGIQEAGKLCPRVDAASAASRSIAILFIDGVKHTLPDYVAAKVRNPRSFGPSLKMPQFTLTPQQVDAVTTALLAQTDRAHDAAGRHAHRPPYSRPSTSPPDTPASSCTTCAASRCHTINGHGGDMAPDLTWEGTAVQRDWLVQFLKNPETLRPALIRRMPKFNLT